MSEEEYIFLVFPYVKAMLDYYGRWISDTNMDPRTDDVDVS